MTKFILRRVLQAAPVLWAALTIAFFLMRLAPGGPFADEKSFPEESIRQLNRHYGLDKPILVQYCRYLGNVMRGDFGPSSSIRTGR